MQRPNWVNNFVFLAGQVHDQPGLYPTASGGVRAGFRLLVPRHLGLPLRGQPEMDDADIFNVTVLAPDLAYWVAQTLERGDTVIVSGWLQSRRVPRREDGGGVSYQVVVDVVAQAVTPADALFPLRIGNTAGGSAGDEARG